MNESDTPALRLIPLGTAFPESARLAAASTSPWEFDTVLRGVLASARDLTRSRYGRWWPYRRPGWSKDPGGLAVRWCVDPGDAHLGGEGAPQRLRNSRTGSAAVRSRLRRARIADIQSKYVRAVQETASGFPTRFPGNTDLSRVPVTADDITQFLGIVVSFRPAELVVLTYRHVHDVPRALDHFQAV